ncbi:MULTISPECIES: palindromic element RPE2 domain-containing protein [Rickettsieae]|uniref:palindromic element RPE2 domain-containing protein n=1 Tax=Rickettsieae TaxID=33988 RepID=UPI000B9BD7CE|nr:palindromic element RPE2 domain-containing protein [Rickettsia endosymbiont of Culicoides newsteadi]
MSYIISCHCFVTTIVNSGGLGSRSDGATPISNRRATSDDVTNFSSIDYKVTSRNGTCVL